MTVYSRAALLLAVLTFINSQFASAFFAPGASMSRPRMVPRMSAAAPPTGQQAAPSTASPGGAAAAAAKRPRREILVTKVIEGNGGFIGKVEVNNFNAMSSHTVTVSKELVTQTLAAAGKENLPTEDYFKAVFKFMIQKGMPLTNTEGMIDAGVFPVNLFAVKQLAYFHADADEGIAAVLTEM